MNSIQVQSVIVHLDSGLNAPTAFQYDAFESSFTSNVVSVTTADETLSLGDIVTARTVSLKLVSGDPVRVGLDGSTYPFRLRAAGECAVLPLDVEGLLETSSITCGADTSGSLSGKYLDLTDRSGTVRVWFDTSGVPEISQIVVNTATSINEKYFDIYDDAGPVRVWIDENNTGTPPATPGGGRLLEVNVAAAPSIADVVNAIQAALDADSKFSATDNNTSTVTVTDASNGIRTNISEPDSATYFTVSTTQQGAATSTAPATPGGGRLLPVTVSVNAANTAVATAVQTELDADDEFTATVSTATVTVTDQHTGTRTDVSAGTTGWTVSVTQQGAASPVIHVKSTGTSQIVAAIAPN